MDNLNRLREITKRLEESPPLEWDFFHSSAIGTVIFDGNKVITSNGLGSAALEKLQKLNFHGSQEVVINNKYYIVNFFPIGKYTGAVIIPLNQVEVKKGQAFI